MAKSAIQRKYSHSWQSDMEDIWTLFRDSPLQQTKREDYQTPWCVNAYIVPHVRDKLIENSRADSRRGWWLTDPPCTEEWKLCWDADTGTVLIMACWCRALALAESGIRLPLIICIDGVCDSASGGLTRCMSFGPCQGEPEVVLIISARLKKIKKYQNIRQK